jgi:hypothetical protein
VLPKQAKTELRLTDYAPQPSPLYQLQKNLTQGRFLANCAGLSITGSTIRSGNGKIRISMSTGELPSSSTKKEPTWAIAQSTCPRGNIPNPMAAAIGFLNVMSFTRSQAKVKV